MTSENRKRSSGRRRFLKVAGVAATGGIAGCVGGEDDDDEPVDDDDEPVDDDDEPVDDDDEPVDDDDEPEGEHSILVGSTFESGHFINEMAREWADTVDEETDGRIEIIIEDMMGGEVEVLEQVEIGAVEAAMPGSMWVNIYAPEYFWLEAPFLFEDWDQQVRAHEESEFGDEARELTIENGNQRVISPPIYRGYRLLTSNDPISEPDELSGVTLRVPELEAWVEIWGGMGADVTTVPFDELYSALQTGVADAQENPAESIIAMNMYEVQDYVTLTEHLVSTGWITINEDIWQELDDSDKDLLETTAADAVEEASQSVMDREEDQVAALEEEYDMEIIETEFEPWGERAEPTLEDLFDTDWEGTVEEVRDI